MSLSFKFLIWSTDNDNKEIILLLPQSLKWRNVPKNVHLMAVILKKFGRYKYLLLYYVKKFFLYRSYTYIITDWQLIIYIFY